MCTAGLESSEQGCKLLNVGPCLIADTTVTTSGRHLITQCPFWRCIWQLLTCPIVSAALQLALVIWVVNSVPHVPHQLGTLWQLVDGSPQGLQPGSVALAVPICHLPPLLREPGLLQRCGGAPAHHFGGQRVLVGDVLGEPAPGVPLQGGPAQAAGQATSVKSASHFKCHNSA